MSQNKLSEVIKNIEWILTLKKQSLNINNFKQNFKVNSKLIKPLFYFIWFEKLVSIFQVTFRFFELFSKQAIAGQVLDQII